MVNNSININKTNNHLSSQLTECKKTYNICPGLGQAQKYGRVKPVNGIPTVPSWRCHWLVNSKGQSEMNPYVALLDVCVHFVYRQTYEYKKELTNISEILATRLVESLTHHFVQKIIKNALVGLVTFWDSSKFYPTK